MDEAGRKVYDKWTEEQETFLIDLWAEYDNELESAQSRKYWVKIQERLKKRFKSSRSVTQIQRKIRYLKEQSKKAMTGTGGKQAVTEKAARILTKSTKLLAERIQ